MNTAQKIEIMQAWEDGKVVQWRDLSVGGWKDMATKGSYIPSWAWEQQTYRIKPVEEYVPWTVETFPKDRPVWVKPDGGGWTGRLSLIDTIGPNGITMRSTRPNDQHSNSWESLFRMFVQADGTPCGTKVL